MNYESGRAPKAFGALFYHCARRWRSTFARVSVQKRCRAKTRGIFRSAVTLVERVLPYGDLDAVIVIGFVAFRDYVCVVGLGRDGVGAFHTSSIPIKGCGDGEAIANWRRVNLTERCRVGVKVEPSLRRAGVGLTLILNRGD